MLEIDEIPEERQNVQHSTSGFISGLVGGLAGLAVGHPFDTVKVRLQSRDLATKYTGTWHCFKTIIQQEKMLGLYKGVTSPAAGVAIVNALVFGSFNGLLQYQVGNNSDNPSAFQILVAGMGAGIVTSIVTCPMEFVKIQLQNQVKHSDTFYRGPIDCVTRLYRLGGIQYCFSGMVPTVCRELSFGPYFLAYEYTCQLTPGDDNGLKTIFAGGTAGIVAWCSTYPADVVKTRMQAEPGRYKGTLDCLRQCIHKEGYHSLFRGLTPTLIRAFPCNAATFVAYAWTMRFLAPSNRERVKRHDEAIL